MTDVTPWLWQIAHEVAVVAAMALASAICLT